VGTGERKVSVINSLRIGGSASGNKSIHYNCFSLNRIEMSVGFKGLRSGLLWKMDHAGRVSVSTARKNCPWGIQQSVLRLHASQTAESSHHKNVKRAFHPMNKVKQSAAMRFLAFKGPRPEQIQTELGDVYQRQAFQLLAVKKWHFRVADRTRDLEDKK
jgi:hypothetical protein